tara:strand:+ start:207 stop:533 length:327 start_codon:yes stop_codon:yes gene_type:complete
MAKKKKNKLGKILAAGAALAGLGAIMRNRGNRGLTADMPRSMVPMDDRMVQGLNFPAGTDLSGISDLAKVGSIDMLKKGGRAGYGKGGKVSRGCGKVMAGRNKKTKYI